MWIDSETELDFVNFSGVADTVAEIIVQAAGRPISIGVSGAWGIGKSSMIKLTRRSLAARPRVEGERDFVFVEFNAWLYQGYDDARAALMDVIATKLNEEAQSRKKAVEKAKEFLGRVNWLRVAKIAAGSAGLAFGLPPTGLIGDIWDIGRRALSGSVDKELIDEAKARAGEVAEVAGTLLKPKPDQSPPKEIHALRAAFEEVLEELGITLVVLIDDLDRCLPPTTISTLEAVRLFLFLKNTAFVIAADDEMIKHAVRAHFVGVQDEALVTSYFDKLIQVPIRVPALGTQEVRAYMMLLYITNSDLAAGDKEKIRAAVCSQLRQTWQGKRVDRAFVASLHTDMSVELNAKLDTAERLAPLMATASGISGNPRLIKRLLNALAMRMIISTAQGVGVDEAVLAKLLLFERLGNPKAYAELVKAVTTNSNGRPAFLSQWEEDLHSGKDVKLRDHWDGDFAREWLMLPPALAAADLRGALYVGREHAPLITPEDRLSSDAAELLTALLEHPEMASSLKDKLKGIPRPEMSVMMDRLLDRARQEQAWGTPPILDACMVLGSVDLPLGGRLAAFLIERPAAQIQPSIVPKIGDQPWAKAVLTAWDKMLVSKPVKNAIKAAHT